MKRGWTEVALGDVCRFEKGTSPTMKTLPGKFPLVVTAAYRRTSDAFNSMSLPPVFQSYPRPGMGMQRFIGYITKKESSH